MTTWKGPFGSVFLQALKGAYAERILELAKDDEG